MEGTAPWSFTVRERAWTGASTPTGAETGTMLPVPTVTLNGIQAHTNIAVSASLLWHLRSWARHLHGDI